MNMRRGRGSDQSSERFVNGEQIAVEGEGAESSSGTGGWRNLGGSEEGCGVNGVGVCGDGECESKDKGPGQETLEHRGFSLRTGAGVVGCNQKVVRWFE